MTLKYHSEVIVMPEKFKSEYDPLDYPEGSALVDVKYYSYPEKLEVVYLNPITNRLEVKYEDPVMDVWFLREKFRTNKYQIAHTETSKAYRVICKVSQVAKTIAQHIGGEWAEWFAGNATLTNYERTKKMCKCPWVFKADFLPDVYFRLRWLQQYGRDYDVTKVTFALLDIEVDVLDKSVSMTDHNDVTQPINAITIILPSEKICAVHVLGPRKLESEGGDLHDSYKELLEKQRVEWEWLKTHQEEFKQRIVNDDKDNKKYLKDYRIDLWLFDYKDEINLIKNVFLYIDKYRPMFTLSWNAPFDDNYLMNRLYYKGYDAREFFIPKEFETNMLYFTEERDGGVAIKNSTCWFNSSSYTTYMCQERLFAMIRKSQSEQRSYSLNNIGKRFAGIEKLADAKEGRFREFAYVNFLLFILYNVRDVVVQLAIELTCHDTQSLMSRSYMFATRFSRCFKETHIVRNIREWYYENEGFVQACRLEVDKDIDTYFKGAFVADPAYNSPTGLAVNGKYVSFYIIGAADADAKAYYPSTKIGGNLDPMSLKYKCVIDNQVFVKAMCSNRSFNQEYYITDDKGKTHSEDISAPMLNSYKNGNISSVSYLYLGLASVTEYIDAIETTYNVIN